MRLRARTSQSECMYIYKSVSGSIMINEIDRIIFHVYARPLPVYFSPEIAVMKKLYSFRELVVANSFEI